MAQSKIWFITGTSRGFGRLWTEAALARGDKVVATARNVAALQDLSEQYGEALLVLPLDVTDRDAVFATLARAHAHFGRLDIVVSNAGYGVMGAVEEVGVEATRANFETNFFGTLSVIQAALPLLRAQGGGHILPVSSVAGLVTFPLGGIYHASKFAVVGLAEGLAQEVAQFGIKVTVIEPGPFATEFMSADSMVHGTPMAEYEAIRAPMLAAFDPSGFPDPKTTVSPLLKVVDMAEPPLHLLLGPLLPTVQAIYASRLQTLVDSVALSA